MLPTILPWASVISPIMIEEKSVFIATSIYMYIEQLQERYAHITFSDVPRPQIYDAGKSIYLPLVSARLGNAR